MLKAEPIFGYTPYMHDRFNLKTFSNMRVFLTIHIRPRSTIRMIKGHCERDPVDAIEDYVPMIGIFNKINRMTDILNSREPSKDLKT